MTSITHRAGSDLFLPKKSTELLVKSTETQTSPVTFSDTPSLLVAWLSRLSSLPPSTPFGNEGTQRELK